MKTVLAAAFLAFGPLAAAQQWASEFKGSPVQFFDREDHRLLEQTMYTALDQPSGNRPVTWENPKTGHKGNIVVVRDFNSKGRDCKELQFNNEAQGRKGDERLSFCRIDGKWRALGSSQL